jgi:hypothetical protein
MESLNTTIRKMLNEGIGYAVDQGYGGFARPVYGGNDNNQGAFRRIGMGDRRSQPTDYKGGLPPIVDPYYNNNQYRSMGGRSPTTPPPRDTGNPNFPVYTYPPAPRKPSYYNKLTNMNAPISVGNQGYGNGGYQTRSLPYGGRAEPTDFGGYANPYGG